MIRTGGCSQEEMMAEWQRDRFQVEEWSKWMQKWLMALYTALSFQHNVKTLTTRAKRPWHLQWLESNTQSYAIVSTTSRKLELLRSSDEQTSSSNRHFFFSCYWRPGPPRCSRKTPTATCNTPLNSGRLGGKGNLSNILQCRTTMFCWTGKSSQM